VSAPPVAARSAALILAAALAVATAAPVLAGGGLPHLSNFEAGPHVVALYNDSPTLVTGRNVLTLEVPPDADPASAVLDLANAAGRSIHVQLRKVSVRGGGESGGHGGAGGHGAAGEASSAHASGHASGHDSSGASGHSAAGSAASGVHQAGTPEQAVEGAVAPKVRLRGAVDIPATGTWTARLRLADSSGVTYTAEATLAAVDGGPNRLYLVLTGSLIGGAVLLGTIVRRLRPAPAVAATRRTK